MKLQLVRSLANLTALALAAGLLSGCAWSVGGGKECERAATEHPTRGKELMDLKQAHEQGAISDAEYEQGKTRILKQ